MKALIVGGGIGGFATALGLHAVGIESEIFEQSREIRELGVGINLLPHATKVLAELGLLDALDRVGIRTHELLYTNRFGQELWHELRGCAAGYDYPQLSIHRGKLQGVLHEVARARIGASHIHVAHRLHDFAQDDHGVTATFTLSDGSNGTMVATGDALIAADGIHSAVRHTFYPDEGPPTWNGVMLWRGAVAFPPFLTGRSMIIAGGMRAKLVLYPISKEAGDAGTHLLNWAVAAKLSDGSAPPPRREDWSRPGKLDELLPHVQGMFQLPAIDPIKIICATPEFYEYPMCDRDPLPHWTFGRVTLLGDAAHPMYPVGSNGASQAILDARCLARLLAGTKDVATALRAYESARLPVTAQIVQDNRSGGPERVIDVIEERAPRGFKHIEEIASRAELEAIVKGYTKMAGFDQTQVNR
jgi:2-polyprenyl-6-methoxyphenol hydroxylase-like FAD-dependent oxidoreductase